MSALFNGLRSSHRAEQRAPQDAYTDEKQIADTQASSETGSESEVAAALGINEKKLLRKLDMHLLPGVCALYLLSFLDRSNVANARLEGLTTDLGMTGNQYLTGLTIFFIGYILLEVLWNVILKRVGPKIWLPLITFVWGIVATAQGAVVNNGGASGIAGFFVVRFMRECSAVGKVREAMILTNVQSVLLRVGSSRVWYSTFRCGINAQNVNSASRCSSLWLHWLVRLGVLWRTASDSCEALEVCLGGKQQATLIVHSLY